MIAKKSHHFEKTEMNKRSNVQLSIFKSIFKGKFYFYNYNLFKILYFYSPLNSTNILIIYFFNFIKGLIEYIRRQKYDRYGFQQLQIDMLILCQISYEMVSIDDESLIFGFYHEII